MPGFGGFGGGYRGEDLGDIDVGPSRSLGNFGGMQQAPMSAQGGGFPDYYEIRDPRSGKTYKWRQPQPPTPQQAKQFIYDEDNKSLWQKIEAPLSYWPTEVSRRMSANRPESPFGLEAAIGSIIGRKDTDSPAMAAARGFGRGAIETIGDIGSSLTSPLNIGMTAATLGTGTAARLGLGGLATGFNIAEKGFGGLQAGHGLYKTGKGLYEGEPGDVGAGILETAFGGLGMLSKVPPVRGAVRPTPRPRPQLGAGTPPRGLSPGGELGIPRPQPPPDFVEGVGTRVPTRGQFQPDFMEGEILEDITGTPIQGQVLGEQKLLSPARPTYYGSRTGTSTDIDAVSGPYLRPRVDVEPQAYTGTGRLEDLEAPISRARGAVRNPATGLENVSDTDLDFMASSGDQAAALELRNRAKAARAIPSEKLIPEEITPSGLEPEGGATLEDLGAPQPLVDRLRKSLGKQKTGLENIADEDIEWMAQSGDNVAVAEAKKRPNVWERLKAWNREKGETGAIGPETGRLKREQSLARERYRAEERAKRFEPRKYLSGQRRSRYSEEAPGMTKAEAPPQEAPTPTGEIPEVLPRGVKGLEEEEARLFAERVRRNRAGIPSIEEPKGLFRRFIEEEEGGMDFDEMRRRFKEKIGDITEGPRMGVAKFEPKPPKPAIDKFGPKAEIAPLDKWDVGGEEFVSEVDNPQELISKYGPKAKETAPVNKMNVPDEVESHLRDRQTLRDYGVPETTIAKYTPEQAADMVERLKTEGGFFKIGGKKGGKKEPGRFSKIFQPAVGTKYEAEFANWVNKARASDVEGILVGKKFTDLKDVGTEGIRAFASGSRAGKLADVENYFKKKTMEMKKAGVSLRGESDAQQIWKDEPDAVREVYKDMGKRPTFTLGSIFSDIREGMDEGLTPKFNNFEEMIKWYETRANRQIANKEFAELAQEKGWIKPQGEGEYGWRELDPKYFPPEWVEGKQRRMTAPPTLHEIINNYIGEESKFPRIGGDIASLSKNMALSAGIPGTGVNAHGFNILARSVIGNPSQAMKTGKYMIRPNTAKADLDAVLHTAPEAVKNGLTLSTEGYSFGEAGGSSAIIKRLLGGRVGGKLEKGLEVTGRAFEDPLFQKIIPALKLKHYNDLVGDMVKNGMSRSNAGKVAAEYTNNIYGGINWEALGRSRDLQNLNKVAILAPDWAETNIRLGMKTGKAAATIFKPGSPQDKLYQNAVRNLTIAYIGANVVNAALNDGQLMIQNAPGHTLDIQMGSALDDEGKIRYFRPFGTAADFLRLPADIASAAMKQGPKGWEPDFGTASQTAKNRLSIPLGAGMNLIEKRDRFGRPIMGRDDYGRPIPPLEQIGGIASEVTSVATPPYAKSAWDKLVGRIGWEEAVAGGTESPFRYAAKPKPPSGMGRPTRRRATR